MSNSVSPLGRCGVGLSSVVVAAVWHVVIQHLVGLDEVPLHGRHLGHDLLSMELGRIRLPLALSLVFVLGELKKGQSRR